MRIDKNQSGFALLVFIVVLLGIAGIAGSSLLQNKTKTVYVEKIEHDQAVLKKAKEALLDYAVEYQKTNQLDEIGRLPCPDVRFEAPPTGTSEGVQDTPCGGKNINSVGLLPWKTLGLEPLRDSSGECLWYVVSGDYKDAIKADMLNEDTNGLLDIQDENTFPYYAGNPEDRPVAIIIAPGTTLEGQDRSITSGVNMQHCRGNYGEENYIEGGGIIDYTVDHTNTADAIWTYLYGTEGKSLKNSSYNDSMVWITRSEYWEAIKAQKDLDSSDNTKGINQLTKALAQCLANYANDVNNENHWLPWPAPIDLSEYRLDANYDDQDHPALLMGRFPVNIEDSNDEEDDETPDPVVLFTDMQDIVSDADCLPTSGVAGPNLDAEKKLWQNWKDHFFYVVSSDFEMDGSSSTLNSRCNSVGDCVTVNGITSGTRVAGIVFYSDSIVPGGQSRDAEPLETLDEKALLNRYLDNDSPKNNAHQYPSGGSIYYRGSESLADGINDLLYCIVVDPGPPSSLIVTDCT